MRKYDIHWNCLSTVELMNWKTQYTLILKSWEKRKLWTLSKDRKVFNTNRDPDRHTMNKLDAYWFNVVLLEQLDPYTEIIVKQKWTFIKLTTTVEQVMKKWTYLYFLTEWFEKQIFLRKSEFKMIV